MLYLVATPIGHLSDITLRAIEILKACDYILCEDTRHTLPLLQHYHIHQPLKSYHAFNESAREEEILADLKSGLSIACLSDAGTPGICDPGHRLVMRCRQEKVPVTAIPGACALILALTLSGFPTDRFQFVGFLPKKSSELKKRCQDILHYPGTTLCYESPHRILDTLHLLALLDGERTLAIARELTKIFEECLHGNAQTLLTHFQKFPPRGEMVLLISPYDKSIDYSALSPQEHVKLLQEEFGLSLPEAIKAVAHLREVPKREIYQEWHRLST